MARAEGAAPDKHHSARRRQSPMRTGDPSTPRTVRPSRGPFDSGLLAPDGTRPSERSFRLAKQLGLAVGERSAPSVIKAYLGAVSRAPAEHLEILRRRDGRIVFAPTIGAALTGQALGARR